MDDNEKIFNFSDFPEEGCLWQKFVIILQDAISEFYLAVRQLADENEKNLIFLNVTMVTFYFDATS
jgi:hypothetical protein